MYRLDEFLFSRKCSWYSDLAPDRTISCSNPDRGRSFSSPNRPYSLWGPPSLLFCGYRDSFVGGGTGLKLPEIDHSFPSSAKLKNERSCTYTPPVCVQDMCGGEVRIFFNLNLILRTTLRVLTPSLRPVSSTLKMVKASTWPALATTLQKVPLDLQSVAVRTSDISPLTYPCVIKVGDPVSHVPARSKLSRQLPPTH